MAKLNMLGFQLCAMQRERKAILEFLQIRGVAEIKTTNDPYKGFTKTDTQTDYIYFAKNSGRVARAITILDKAQPREKVGPAFLRGRRVIGEERIKRVAADATDIIRKADRALELAEEIDKARADINNAQTHIALTKAWSGLPVSERFAGTRRTVVFIGSLQWELTAEAIIKLFAENASEGELSSDGDLSSRVHVEVVYAGLGQTHFFVIAPRKLEREVEQRLNAHGFSKAAQPSYDKPPVERVADLEKIIQDHTELIGSMEDEIRSLSSYAEQFELLQDYYTMRAEKYRVINNLAQSKHTFIIEGYVPERDAEDLRRGLNERFSLSFDLFQADADAPTLLSNPRYASALSGVLESYSVPGYYELDPLPVMSIFYYIVFGLMFSDAAYGFILAAVCGFALIKYTNMEENWKNNVTMFFWCGVSTLIWGVVFSSYFGDVVNVVSRTFFGREVGIPPLWFAPMDNPMLLLMFCLGIGVLHLSAGYIMKALTLIKNRQTLDAFFDGALPLLAMLPIILILMGSELFGGLAGFTIILPKPWDSFILYFALLMLGGVVLTAGRSSKNIIVRLLLGIYAIYNLFAGWLSDVLSYSRLLALGLATGVIAQVMNQIGSMFGGGVVGFILFLIVFAIGQALNFGINVLGAYVHSNRLAYVEFFGKFYEGGGKKFNPFGVHTKYIKIEEAN
ncbi:MAG: V-type ATP synthase subunit I [Clostridiales bacterium]|jgi:V/A-type H+-transporting ATPase subunit I|nr:V-type ATP synthase subunit I [Clostridiales bacterium]